MTKSKIDNIKFAISAVAATVAGTIIGMLIISCPIIISWGVFFFVGKWSK